MRILVSCLLALLMFGCLGQPAAEQPGQPFQQPARPPSTPPPAQPPSLPSNTTPPAQPSPNPTQPAVSHEAGITIYRDLAYSNVSNKTRLDLYVPDNAPSQLPLLIYIHGGGWSAGDKADFDVGSLPERGYAVASVGYRLSGEAEWPAQIYDVKAAVRWLRANSARYNLDPGSFGVMGHSAGGHLAALLGTSGGVAELEGGEGNPQHSSRVQAVVDFYGPTDFIAVENASIGAPYGGYASMASSLFGGPIIQNHAKAVAASPLTHVTPDDPPFLIFHGDLDDIVPYGQSMELDAVLARAGVNSTLYIVKGGGHGGFEQRINASATYLAFLDAHLKPAKP